MRRLTRIATLVGCVASVASCVAEGDAGPTAALQNVAAAAPLSDIQPSRATYRCGDDGVLTVENMRSSVVLVDPHGESVTLPASPAAQQTRYGQTGYALVLEGNEALYMKGGKEPLTCRR